jgi:multidrug efflux pump subunit AcrB
MGTITDQEDEFDIVGLLPEGRRHDINTVMSLRILDAQGRPVPLSSVAMVTLDSGVGAITHIDQDRVVTVTADVEVEGNRTSTDVLEDVKERLEDFDLPVGYHLSYTGENEEMEESSAFLLRAFVIALLLIFMVLVTQFNSLSKPFIILSSVVLSIIGVLLGLMITRNPFSTIMTGIAVISLAGVVVNNAIVLIDYIEQLRKKHGLSAREAVIEAGITRFRPVMLTAITTVLGLLPMAVGVSMDFRTREWQIGAESSQWWGQMAIAVIFGLSVATVLTLVVVPSLYMVFEQLRTVVWKALRWDDPYAAFEKHALRGSVSTFASFRDVAFRGELPSTPPDIHPKQ